MAARWVGEGHPGVPPKRTSFSQPPPPPPPPPPPRRVVSAERFPGAVPSHTSHGPRTERWRQLWRIVQATHGCRHLWVCVCLCSLCASHTIRSLTPPHPLRPASPLHYPDSRRFHPMSLLFLLDSHAGVESNWGKSLVSAALEWSWVLRRVRFLSLSLPVSGNADPLLRKRLLM